MDRGRNRGMTPAPPSEPDGRFSRIKCGALHKMRYVVNYNMWY